MSDRWVVTMAVCAALGALRPSPLPLWLGIALVAGAFLVRRPEVLCLGTLVLVSVLAARSLTGLDGVVAEALAGEVTLLSDPLPTLGGVRADVRSGSRRLELRAEGPTAVAMRDRLAGERIVIRGEVQPTPPDTPWLTARHIAGRLRVYAVESWRPGGSFTRVANGLRRTLEVGAAPLTPVQRSLYTGLVIGDDRAQPAEMADDFQGAGLTHLLAVSGQNVAFALALAGPLLRRVRLWSRLALTLGVIGMFGLMTRFEPSVLRAAAMAGLATTLLVLGGPVSRVRVLALAITALLVVDPLLIRSVGFQLSTGATTAIIVLGPRLVDALPGPLMLREALSVTVAAQLGVAPVLLATFGPLPVASFPANLLAVPAAGPLMVWGLTGGLAAGVVGGRVAALLHVPSRVLLTWVGEVARQASALPLGTLQAGHLVALALGLVIATKRRRWGIGIAAASVAVAVISAQAPASLRSDLAPGVVRWHHESTDVVVLGGIGGRTVMGASSTLAALREEGVRTIAALVVADRSISPHLIVSVETRHRVGTILLAPGVDRPDFVDVRAAVVIAPRQPAVVDIGALEVHLTPTPERLVVEAIGSSR
ncbi:MAG: ComEC/Rec2 family competence protein [Acidimicrobiales bacterium]